MSKRTRRRKKEPCACSKWVTGPLAFRLETDAAEGDPVFLEILTPWPARTSISERGIRRHDQKLPGCMEIQESSGGRGRVVFRVDNTREKAYSIFGVCPCGNLLIERDGP